MRRVAPILMLLALVACHAGGVPRQKQSSKLAVPSTFTGVLPCADCEGIRYHLDLWADHTFHLQREWLGQKLIQFDIGKWSLDSERKVLVLDTAGKTVMQFEAVHPKSLRLLDTDGHHIQSKLNYTISSKGRLEPVDITLPLRGQVSLDGTTLRFAECLTGRAYVVGEEGESAAMRQALIAAASDSVYVTIEGTLHLTNVTVRRFISSWPMESCERSLADATLTNTRWRLDRLDHETIRPAEGQREPYLTLRNDANGATYGASAGCNQMAGSYAVSGESLSFSPGPMTMMACAPPLDALEKRLADALARTRRFRVLGNTLELMDESGGTLALFEALYLK